MNYSKVLASPCLPFSLIKTSMDLTRAYLTTWMVWMGPNLDQLLKNNSWHLLFGFGSGWTHTHPRRCCQSILCEKKGLVQSVAIPTQEVFFLCIFHSLPLLLVCHLHSCMFFLIQKKKTEELRIVSLCHACCAVVSEYTDSSNSRNSTNRCIGIWYNKVDVGRHCRCGQQNQPT